MLAAARPEEPAISRTLFLSLVAGLRKLEVDVQVPLAQLGLRVSDLTDLPERMKPEVLYDLWDSVTSTTGQSGFGLRIAEGVTVDQYSTFGRILAASSTVGDALARGVRFFRLLSERIRFAVRMDGRQAAVVLDRVDRGRLHREGAEFLIGGVVTLGRRLSDKPGAPLAVHFTHDTPPHAPEAEAFFGCKVQYGASENSVVFASEVLLLPVKGHDPTLCAELQREAETLLSELSEPTTFRRDVVNAISRDLAAGHSGGIVRIAAMLGMHPKALGRSLQADGATYRELLDDVRLHLARRYLEEREISVTEIAFRLGYSEKSAFNRAFKRWTGKAPEQFRDG